MLGCIVKSVKKKKKEHRRRRKSRKRVYEMHKEDEEGEERISIGIYDRGEGLNWGCLSDMFQSVCTVVLRSFGS